MEAKKPFKMPSTLPALVGVLLVIASLSGVLLAVTYGATKDTIAAVEVRKIQDAFKTVRDGFDNNPLAEVRESASGALVYPLRTGGALMGYALLGRSGAGYGGDIEVMVGVDRSGAITGIKVLKASETPGLGSNISGEAFLGQFLGKTINTGFTVKKDGGKVDAISAATISSRAVCEALDQAGRAFAEVKDE